MTARPSTAWQAETTDGYGPAPVTGSVRVNVGWALLVGALVLAASLSSPVGAQETWMPTVATVPGTASSSEFPGAAPLPPLMVDPRLFPPSRPTLPGARDPFPQGAWSPIVTGAIPEPRPVVVPSGVAPAQGATSRDLEPVVGPTPLRPVTPGITTSAAAETTKETAAAPAGSGSVSVEAPEEDSTSVEGSGEMFKKPGPLDALPPNANAAQQYCFNTVDTAADARFAWQAKKIQKMEAALDKKAQQLMAKTDEYKTWLDRRDTFARKAHEKLVGFYSKMRPDAAAVQLATIEEETAAAVLMKLETKVASLIMGEMDPERAAKVATIISGAAKVPPEAKRGAGTPASAPSSALPDLDEIPPAGRPRS